MSSEGGKIGGTASVGSHGAQMANGGTASVGSHGAQMANGGIASMKKKKESPPRDANYKMASGLGAANVHEQMSSEGGTAAALANAQHRRRNEDGQSAYTYTTERLEGDNMPYARGLALGDYLLQQEAFEMEVLTAVLKVPVITKKRKRRVAEQMVPEISPGSYSYRQGEFHRAWKKHKHL
jgi:hypothetical protein